MAATVAAGGAEGVRREEKDDGIDIRELRFQGNARGDVISRSTRPESFLYPMRGKGRPKSVRTISETF